jgi:hypothetical protein
VEVRLDLVGPGQAESGVNEKAKLQGFAGRIVGRKAEQWVRASMLAEQG